MRSQAIQKALLPLIFAACAFAPSIPADSPAAAPAAELKLPADIVYTPAGHADSAVVFSHQTHFMLAGNRCTGCHPALFPMLKRGSAPRHRTMNAGASCGTCHDGKQAFGVADTMACRTCHTGPRTEVAAATGRAPADSGQTAAPRLPKPHTYPSSEGSPGRVTFRHKTHVGGTAGCAACHPKPFRMAAAAPLPDFGMHEPAACGACHDGGKAFATDDPANCSRCHVEEGAAP